MNYIRFKSFKVCVENICFTKKKELRKHDCNVLLHYLLLEKFGLLVDLKDYLLF
ncbi:hypothetical protein HanIR_Chr14g0687861 [Helianthus annuus]|nr:hypothetical protein HanIR_Chr14g0687861 [Helianthus annuus]